VLVAFVCVLGGCATLAPAIDPPRVSLVSLRPVPGSGVAPDFEIKLKVVNPNNLALDIAGISYAVEIQGQELLTGVSNDLPRIGAYEEGTATLIASIDGFRLLRLLATVSREEARALDYSLRAKIDFGGLIPTQRIEESGVIDLSGGR
jgi:LEA14-like dessication related protein